MTAVGEVRKDFNSPQMIQTVAAKPWMTWTAAFEALCTKVSNESLAERKFNIIHYIPTPKALDNLTLEDSLYYLKNRSNTFVDDMPRFTEGRVTSIRTSLRVGSISHSRFYDNQDLFDQFSQQRCFSTFGEFLKEKSFCSRYQLLKEQLLEATSLEKQGEAYESYLKDQGFQLDVLYQHLGMEQLKVPRDSQHFMSSLFVMADVAKHLGLRQVLQGDKLTLDALKESFSTYDRLAVLGIFPTLDLQLTTNNQAFNVFNSVLFTNVKGNTVSYIYPGRPNSYNLPFDVLHLSYLLCVCEKKTNRPL